MPEKNAQILAMLTPKLMNSFHDLGSKESHDSKISMRQFQVLMILSVNKKLTVSQLCAKINLAASTGTELVNRMVSMEFIQKEVDAENQRTTNITIAPKGMEFLHTRHNLLVEMFSKFINPFSEEDKDKFTKSFQNIWDIIEKYR